MKRNSLFARRFALTGVAIAAMCLSATNAWALGLGRLAVQSALGETLRAEIDVTSLTPEEASNLNVRIAPPESYRAAGVDYNQVLPATQVVLQRRPDGRAFLKVTSDRAVQEPFVDVILEITWSTGRLVREYTMLFDPPSTRTLAAAPPATSPALSSATEAPSAATPASAPRSTRPAPAPRPAVTADAPPAPARNTPRVAAAPSADTGTETGSGADEYKVKPGDTLSRIAGNTRRQGVSLDQMLASLYQGNPDAFLNNNMNRLKAGAVLAVPSAETAKAITPTEARQLIQAQSADFGAYRQRLASGVAPSKVEGASRQTSGTVQAEVDDRKKAAAPTPDKLTLSKGTASTPEAKVSKELQAKENSSRVAELSKNVEELKKLGQASAGAKAGSPAQAPAPAAVNVPVKPPVTPPPAPPAPAPAPVPAPAPAPVPAPVPAPAPVAPAPAPVAAPAPVIETPASAPAEAAPVAAASAPEAASAPVVAVAPPKPAPAPAPAPAPEPSFLSSLFDDNLPALLGGIAVLLLGGFAAWRFSKRAKRDSGETSFLESRLQPDSFFGASGGQRIDTRDAGGASSSMSYSLSQLDAIGDVDPVAEADVYLAYGRDLQAEEILKEAMRASPERLAIRTKLLEVYAKRRDTKGFELLATQLFGLTGGEGEDWAKAQEIGQQIDPENPMYRPGGAPSTGQGQARPSAEVLGASTMPQSVLPSPSEFGASSSHGSGFDTTGGGMDLDLDLALPSGSAVSAPHLPEETQPLPTGEVGHALDDMSFDLPLDPPPPPPRAAPAPARSAPASAPMDFDLSSISLDLGDSTIPAPAAPRAAAAPASSNEFGDIDLGDTPDDGSDPIARKLELAEEFRQIGDMEGARDLLQEVIAKASGATKTRAQAMLSDLG